MFLFALLHACTPSPAPADDVPVVRIAGSETVTRSLVPSLVETHQRTRKKIRFQVEGGGSGAGFRQLLDGEADIAASTRDPTPAEEEQARVNGYSLQKKGSRHIVGVNVVALSVHPSNPLSSLSYDQVIGIFCTRSVDNWSFLGLDDHPIRAITRDPRSGTRALFEDFFCGPRGIHARTEVGDSDVIAKALKDDPWAISFVTLADREGKVIGLRPDPAGEAVMPSQQNIIRGAYPLYSDLYLFTAGSPRRETAEFVHWIGTPAGQEVVDEARFIPIFLRPDAMDAPRPLRETIHFDVGRDRPNQRSMARLQLLEEELRERAGESQHIILEGYADSTEPNPVKLSQARAQAVRKLLENNLKGLYFEIIPRGKRNPIAPNTTPYGRERNRRVQIYLADEEQLPGNQSVVENDEG